jgi:cytochrome P450
MKKSSPPWFKQLLKRFFSSHRNALVFLAGLVGNEEIIRVPVLRKTYIVNEPEAISRILIQHYENYTKAGTSYERLEKLVGTGMLTTSGEDWAERRNRYQPKFHTKNLQQYESTITQCTQIALDSWEDKLGQQINIADEMLSLVMNITTQAFLGMDISERSLELVKQIHFLNDHAVHKGTFKWIPTIANLRYQNNKTKFDQYLIDTLKHTTKITNNPLLEDLLHKDDQGNFILSNDYILGEAKNFFIAGHETTGSAIASIIFSMTANPYTMTKALDEIKDVLGDQQPTFESIEHLPYLDMVIQEGLRLYPPIWFITRRAIEEDHLLGYKIPANSLVSIVPFLIHRHPKYWPQPNVFYPERFQSDANKKRPKCAYIPFGVGPRVCIGRQFATLTMKMIIVMILQKYRFTLPTPDYAPKLVALMTLTADKGIWLRVMRGGLRK